MLTLDFPSRGRRFRVTYDPYDHGRMPLRIYDRTGVTDPNSDGHFVNGFYPETILAHDPGKPLVVDSQNPVEATLSGIASAYLIGWLTGLRAKVNA